MPRTTVVLHLLKAEKNSLWVRPGRLPAIRLSGQAEMIMMGILSAQAVPTPVSAFMASAGVEVRITAGKRL